MNPARLIILTGASRGMGLAMASQLARRGDALLCLSRSDNSDLDALARTSGARCEQWRVDLAEPAPVAERLLGWLAVQDPSAYASVALINNAAVIGRLGPLDPLDSADIGRALRVGLEAPMALTAAFLQGTRAWPMARRILNISSGLGRRAMAGSALYCAAKAGMDHFSRCVALDEARRGNGARVVSLAPGVIDTDMQATLRSADPAQFPELGNFQNLHTSGALASPEAAAARVLAWLDRPDFGVNPVADVRES
jgi:benzil reductase ((S)-benzoin forming)